MQNSEKLGISQGESAIGKRTVAKAVKEWANRPIDILTPETGPPPLPKLAYSMAEAANVLGVSYITLHRLCKRGLIRSSSALRTKVIPHTELLRFLKETLE